MASRRASRTVVLISLAPAGISGSASTLPSPLRGGVGGGGVGWVFAASGAAVSAADAELAPPPLSPPRKGEGDASGATGVGPAASPSPLSLAIGALTLP